MKRRLLAMIALVAVLAMVGAACSNDDDGGGDTTGTTGTTGGEAITVGVSWNNYNEERWAKWDEPDDQGRIEAGGATYISTDAGSSAEQQITDVENLISQGADVLIILAQDGDGHPAGGATRPGAGHPGHRVRPADRGSGRALHHVRQRRGRTHAGARPCSAQVPKATTSSSRATRPMPTRTSSAAASKRSCRTAEDAGDIVIVGETYTDNWNPALAQTEMEQFLTENNNDVQAVRRENDGMAGGVVAALEAQGLAGRWPVSGQDGDLAALNRVALGTQTGTCLEGRARPRHGGRRGGGRAARTGRTLASVPNTVAVRQPRRELADLDPADPEPDHSGQPE